jgi:DinB superfamily
MERMRNVGNLINEVRNSRSRVLAAVDNLSPAQGAFKPAPDQWCINEILEHLVLAEQSGITKMWLAADGVRSGRPVWTGVHTNRGLSIDAVVARTWKAQEAAPALCAPVFGGPLAYWKEAFALCERLLEALHPALEGLDVENVIYPHFISGPLDLGQRLEFLRFHMNRHNSQIKRVKQTPRFYS